MGEDAKPSMDAIAKTLSGRKRVTVLFSGRGSNMSTLIGASMAADYPAVITNAITNVPDAGGIEVAKGHGIETTILDHKAYASREAHEEAVAKVLKEQRPDLIVLAGYMRIFSASFVRQFVGRIINIHPSLLPSFKGVDTHHRALVSGVRVHGCSVHYVDETLDDGPIIAQAVVPVLPNDNDDSLSARVLKAEHILYPHALSLVASGEIRHSGGRAILNPNFKGGEHQLLISPNTSTKSSTR